MPPDLDRLLDLEQIKQLKARYFRLLDEHRWDEFANLFTEDLRVGPDRSPGESSPGALDSRTRFVARVSRLLDGVTHVHHGHMPEIQFLDADHATGIWAMVDHLRYPDRKEDGYGHYHEDYRRDPDGQWRIAWLHLTRLLMEVTPTA